MKALINKDFPDLISGTNLLATGGGGTPGKALEILQNVKEVKVKSIKELDASSIVCSVFGVGGKQTSDPIIASRAAFSSLQALLGGGVSALIPVEVGPMAMANAIFIANKINVPVLDSDIVGMRSSPEVFLETITLAGIPRTPAVVADDKGNRLVIRKFMNLKNFEKALREFAMACGGDAFVAGYPILKTKLQGIVPEGSISKSLATGKNLKKLKLRQLTLKAFLKRTRWVLLDKGKIEKEIKDSSRGFSEGSYTILTKDSKVTVIFKNENLVVARNGKPILTCPDSISLLDLESASAVNNFEANKGKEVAALGKKAIPIWRTRRGRKLFSPKNLGLDWEQKLLP